MNKDDKLKALDAALTQIEKSYGKGSVMKLVNHNIIPVKSQPFLVVSSHCEAVYFPPVSFRFIHLAFHDSFGDPPV